MQGQRMRSTRSFLALLLLLSLIASACGTTGGRPATLGEAMERQSQEMAAQLEASGALVADPALNAYVSAVGQRLVAQADASPVAEFNFAVLDMPEPNAFAIPSGHVYVSRGLLVLMSSEDELAGVLGHEIGHVLKRHSLKQASASLAWAPLRMVTSLGGGIVGLALPSVGNVVKATGDVPAALSGASYGRSQEREADRVGQDLAARAGWDPLALSRVMVALGKQQELMGVDPSKTSWFATHPTSPDRAQRIAAHAAELTVSEARPVAASHAAFLAELEGLVVGASARHGIFDGSEFLHPEMGFVLSFPEGQPWHQINSEQAVAVVREQPPAAVILQIVAQGDDALAVANAFEPRQGRLDGPPNGETVNGLATAHATGGDPGGWRRPATRGSARWIAYNGYVYRILSESSDEGYARLEKAFDASQRSFRALSSADRARITEDRLAIERAREDEKLSAVLERAGSSWALAQAAAANGVEPDARFERGDLVKVTRSKRYSEKR